jgi:hypothetical protein
MIWECTECGGRAEHGRPPGVCSECGVGVRFVPSETDPEAVLLHNPWIRREFERASRRTRQLRARRRASLADLT